MCDDDEPQFYELLLNTDEAIRPGSKPRTPGAMNLVFDDLRQYPLDLVAKALTAHRRDPERGQWVPNSAHIEHQINIRRPIVWLSADEAWARAPKENSKPAVLTNEVAQALAVAQPFIDQMHQNADGSLTPRPDLVAARMAFKACYDRLIDRAKLERRGPKYFVSPGGSFDEQQAVVDEGVRMGLLPAPAPAVVVQQIEHKPRTPGAKPDLKALLLSLNTRTMPAPEAVDYE